MEDFNCENTLVDALYITMDRKLELVFPPLKYAVSIFSVLHKCPQETYIQFYERVKQTLITGGIGTKESFDLSQDRLIIILVIKGLNNSDQNEIVHKFDTFDINNDNLMCFLSTLTTVSANHDHNQINFIAKRAKQ